MDLGRILAAYGRGGDSLVAHINPAEAMILKALGGTGARNPKTGLLEFDGGGGGSDPNYGGSGTPAGQAAPNIGALTVGGAPATGGLLQSYTPSYPTTAGTNLPSGTVPIDPSILSSASQWSTSQSGGAGGGITDSFFDPTTNPQAVAYPGNPYYTTNSAGNAVFTPAGQQAYDAWQQQQTSSLAANAAGTNSGLGGLLANPLTGIPLALGLPLGIGLGVDALGAGFGAAAAGGADATVPASMEAAELSADPAAFAEATAAGASGLTGPDLLSALSGGAADIGTSPLASVADSSIGLGGDAASSLGLGDSSSIGIAGPAAGVSPGSAFIGVDSAAPASGLDLSLATDPDLATIGTGGATTGADASAALGSGGIGDWLSNAGSSLLGDITSNPLKALGLATSVGGLGYDLLNKSSSLPGQANLNQIASTLQQGQAGVAGNIANEGSIASGLSNEGNLLSSYIQTGQLPAGVQQSIDQASAAAEASIKSRYAAMGASGSSAEAQDLANVRFLAQSQGSTIALQLLQQGTSDTTEAASITNAMVSQGVQETGLSDQIYTELLNLATQQNAQLGTALAGFATSLARVGSPSTITLNTNAA